MEEIGYDDYFFGDGVSIIEWADLVREIIPEKHTRVLIEKDLKKDKSRLDNHELLLTGMRDSQKDVRKGFSALFNVILVASHKARRSLDNSGFCGSLILQAP